MLVKAGLWLVFLGFLFVGILLAANHPGVAIKLSSYIYLLLLLITSWKAFKYVKD